MPRKDEPQFSTKTKRRGLWAVLRDLYERVVHPPRLMLRLKASGKTLRPAMSRREIRHVADAICRSAQTHAK